MVLHRRTEDREQMAIPEFCLSQMLIQGRSQSFNYRTNTEFESIMGKTLCLCKNFQRDFVGKKNNQNQFILGDMI